MKNSGILMTTAASACYKCGKTLTDPVSMELGIGPVCRLKKKEGEHSDKTINMFANRSEYDWGIRGEILYITDKGGMKSVTNDVENVLGDISKVIGFEDMKKMKIMYRDSMGIWDGIRPAINGTGVKSVSFFPLTERDFDRAFEKLNNLKTI